MSRELSAQIEDHFSELTDPRVRKVTYPLIKIVTIAICAVVARADDFVSMASWAQQKKDWAKIAERCRTLSFEVRDRT